MTNPYEDERGERTAPLQKDKHGNTIVPRVERIEALLDSIDAELDEIKEKLVQ